LGAGLLLIVEEEKGGEQEVEFYKHIHLLMQRVEISYNMQVNDVNGIQSQMVLDKQITLPSDMVKFLEFVSYGGRCPSAWPTTWQGTWPALPSWT